MTASARRIPIIPTIIVLAAIATMGALGVWQLQRKAEKEALLARYDSAIHDDAGVVLGGFSDPAKFYHRAALQCEKVEAVSPMAGRSSAGQSGWAYVASCTTPPGSGGGGERVDVTLGWSHQLRDVSWSGGGVTGRVGPAAHGTGRVIADPPLAGLEANASPDPADIPNNHLAYAGQWFFFALTALVIYILALRRRWRTRPRAG